MTKREPVSPQGDNHVRHGERGQFKESDDVGRSLSQDRHKRATTPVKPGQGDRGDQRRH